MKVQDTVRRNIVKLRQKKGWTQEKLAFEAEISKAGMCVIESGQRSPTVRTLEKIAEALGVAVLQLFR
jgi:transcriptional regulator with XRE-family HTH domain